MKHVTKLLSAATVAMVAGLLFAPPNFADPVHAADLNSPGDELLTVDPNTGLEFLDPGATKGVSYNGTLMSSYVTDQGFRFASLAEYEQLLTDVGFTNFSGNFNVGDEPAAEELLGNLLGETIPPGEDFFLDAPGTQYDAHISDGFYSFTGSPSSGLVNVVGVDYQSEALDQAPQDQARIILHLNHVPPGAAPPIVGGLLVRATAVPEPGAFGLMGLGLALISACGILRRRRNRHSD